MRRVVLLTKDHPLCWMVVNALAGAFPDCVTIIEGRGGPLEVLTRRLRRFGLRKVLGQAAYAPIGRVLRHTSRHRLEQIIRSHDLDPSPGLVAVCRVASINSQDAIDRLQALGPRAIAVCGTRVLGARVLASVSAPFVNIHAGITPAYRGNDAGYWALANGRPECFGVTIHVVDKGLDTGPIVYQKQIAPGREDTIATYPYLQVAEGIPLLIRAVEYALQGNLAARPASGASRLWTKPTIIEYARNVGRHGVW
jgi:methionyl-tRNA formyltransferase